jgi:hypothetical protein
MRSPSLAALALVLVASAAPAAAAPRLHGIPTHVRAGAELRITWTGLGPEAHEAELELSLAGGRWVRISPELEAREGGFTWRVPAGLAGPARLRLKYGGEAFEAEGELSTPFVLEALGDAIANRMSEAGLGEWWCLGRQAGAPEAERFSGAASLHPSAPSHALSPEPDRMTRAVRSAIARASAREPVSVPRECTSCRASLSRMYPLRI